MNLLKKLTDLAVKISKKEKKAESIKEDIDAIVEEKSSVVWDEYQKKIDVIKAERDNAIEVVEADKTIASDERVKLAKVEVEAHNLSVDKSAEIKGLSKGFNKLSREEQKIMIANDVVDSIKVGLYDVRSGSAYFANSNSFLGTEQLQDSIFSGKISEDTCNVCALGSLLITQVKVCNNITTDEATGLDGTDIRKKLNKYFTNSEMNLFESAFEKSIYFMNGDVEITGSMAEFKDEYECEFDRKPNANLVADLKAAVNFGKRFKEDKNRLKAIMNNIIKNEGKFIP